MNTTMHTTIRVTNRGELLGIFPMGEFAAIRELIQANPGADTEVVVTYTACAKHPAFEPHNCPACGTAAVMGN